MPLLDQAVLDYIADHPSAGREDVRRHVAPEASSTTVWRVLRRLVDEGWLVVSGKARATGYSLAASAVVRAHLQVPYNLRMPASYRREFVDRYIPGKTWYLDAEDRRRLHEAGRPQPPPLPAGTYARRILDRLLVDLSWASSRMEGNTYDILQTERLIRHGEAATGTDRREALMILNHKEAIQYVVDHLADISIGRPDLFSIHTLLARGLLYDPTLAGRLRRLPVDIGRSSYRPLEDQYDIAEEFDVVIGKAAEIGEPFEQSFFLLVHIPYLQAFADINKRTSRIASNIPLLKAGLAPMSFLTMEDRAYIDGLLGVYELNNVALLREAYLNAYLSSAPKYRVLRAEVDIPDKAALAYREFVDRAVRRCVLEWKAFRPQAVLAMAAAGGIPEADREHVADHVGREFDALHEGNLIRYRLRPEHLNPLARTGHVTP